MRRLLTAFYRPVLLGFVALAAYLISRQGQHTYDALMFTRAIDLGEFAPTVYRPHNMLYLPTAIGLRRVAGVAAGAGGVDPFWIGLMLSALGGAAAVGLFFALVRRFLPVGKALPLTVLLASSHAVWAMSTEIEVYSLSLAAVAGLYLTLARRHPSRWAAGLLYGLCILAHLTNVLLMIPMFAHALAWPLGRRAGAKWSFFFAVVALGLAIAGAVYAVVGFLLVDCGSPGGLVRWGISYAANQETYGISTVRRIADGILGFKRALVDGPAKALMVFHALLIAASLLSLRIMRPGTRRIVAVLVVHLVVYGAFFSWWEPLNIEFWVVTLLPLFVIVGMGWRGMRARWERTGFAILVGGALGVQLFFNGTYAWNARDPAKDYWMLRAKAIAREIQDGDLVVTFNDPLVFAMPLAVRHSSVASVAMLAGAEDADFQRAMDRIGEYSRAARKDGGSVYVTAEGMNPDPIQLAPFRISVEEYRERLRAALGTELGESVAEGLLFR